jgi:hypothetical protein
VGVAVVVEKVGDAEAPDRHRVACHRPASGEFIEASHDDFTCRSEAEIVRPIEPRDVRFGRGPRDARHLAVGEVGNAVGVAKAAAASQFGIEVKLGIGR